MTEHIDPRPAHLDRRRDGRGQASRDMTVLEQIVEVFEVSRRRSYGNDPNVDGERGECSRCLRRTVANGDDFCAECRRRSGDKADEDNEEALQQWMQLRRVDLKRVPLDFELDVGEPWRGYVLPLPDCPDCARGLNPAGQWLETLVDLLMGLGNHAQGRGALGGSLASLPTRPKRSPGAEFAELTNGLAGRNPVPGIQHDVRDTWAAMDKLIQVAGLPEDWPVCPTCGGESVLLDQASDEDAAWEPYDPPSGTGYQLWSMDECCPLTPVFATWAGLCRYVHDHHKLAVDDVGDLREVLDLPEGAWWSLPAGIDDQKGTTNQ